MIIFWECHRSMKTKSTKTYTQVNFKCRLPRWLGGKGSACQCRRCNRCRSIPRFGRFHGEEDGNPSLVFLPGKCHRQRSLAGYCPWGHRELDMTGHIAQSNFKWALQIVNNHFSSHVNFLTLSSYYLLYSLT